MDPSFTKRTAERFGPPETDPFVKLLLKVHPSFDRHGLCHPFWALESIEAMPTSKKVITREDWEKKLKDVKIRKEDMNKLVMNLLVTEGYVDTAEKFRMESGIEPELNLTIIADRKAVIKAVHSGNIQEAIEMVNHLYPEILNNNPSLYFYLQQQKLIELIGNEEVEEAQEFARAELAPIFFNPRFAWIPHLPKLSDQFARTFALLAFEDPRMCPFGELLDISQRVNTARELNAAILTSQSHEKDPTITRLLKWLIWTQAQIDDKVAYPRINDIATMALEEPFTDDDIPYESFFSFLSELEETDYN